MTTVFLSYARADEGESYDPATSFVARLHADLTKAGFDVWFDRVSMPSRSLTFHQEIRDAIAARDRLILVVGPKAVTSDYVTQEWQFAYLAANKCVNPIVRLNGRDAQGKTVDGYQLIPEDLKLLHAEDFRDDAHYYEHLQNLIRQLSEDLPPVGKLVAVPELPPGYRAQPERIKVLRDLLLIDLQKPVVVSGAGARVGLQGMGGIGKSVLANALAHHPEIQRAFKDNIYWLSIGQAPHIEELQRWLARELGDEGLFNSIQTGKETLRKLLRDRAALLILDDVWEREHAEAFNVVGPLGRILLTTRDTGLVTALAARENHYRVELPSEVEAEGLLASAANIAPEDLPSTAHAIIAQCGRLPLALALCGGMVQGGVSWDHVLEALREHDLEYLSSEHPAEEQHRNAWTAMDVSLRALPEDQRERFAELAVFGLDIGASDAAVATLWAHTAGMSARQTDKLLAELARRSLVQRNRTEGDNSPSRIHLHDLLHNFAEGMAIKRFGSRAGLHRALLEAYRKLCPSGWPSGPNDGYFLQHLCGHLVAGDQLDEAVTLLTDLPWIEAKCRVGLVFELQGDYQEVLAVLPEMQANLHNEQQCSSRLARWTDDLIHYSQVWSERRDQITRGMRKQCAMPRTLPWIKGILALLQSCRSRQNWNLVTGQPLNPEPLLLEVPATCQIWSDEVIEKECKRIRDAPTRVDRLRIFAGFVRSECYPLVHFGGIQNFVLMHAHNHAPGRPVHETALSQLSGCRAPYLVRHWQKHATWIPKPSLLSTLEVPGFVACVEVTPDGRRAVSGSRDDSTLTVWDLQTGACLRLLEGHSSGVVSVSVTPDGRRAVSGSMDNTLRVWDLESGSCMRVLEGHTTTVLSVSVTPNGRQAVSGGGRAKMGIIPPSDDNTLRIWDLETGTCVRKLQGHSNTVNSVSATPDGRWAVSASSDKTLRVWDLEIGTCVRKLQGHSDTVNSVSATPDGRWAVSASSDKTLRVWDLETGTCVRKLQGHSDTVNSVSATPDGRRAVSGSDDRTIRLWDIESGASLGDLCGHSSTVNSLTVTDGQRAVSGSTDDTLRVWDLENTVCLRTLTGHRGSVNSLSVTPDGRQVISASSDKTLRLWSLESGACLAVLEGHRSLVNSVSVMPDGRRAVSAGGRNKEDLLIFLLSRLGVLKDSEVSEVNDNTLRVWDLENGVCLMVMEGHTDGVSNLSVTPDGRRAVSASWDKTLRVWDLETGVCVEVLEGHTKGISGVIVTPDGGRAVSWSGYMLSKGTDNTVRVWNLERGACLAVLEGHTDRVSNVSVTPDGRQAVSGSSDKTLRVWDLETGTCVRTLQGHSSTVESVSVSSDGRRAVSGSDDRTIRLWDLVVGECLAVCVAEASVEALVQSANGLSVVVGLSTGQMIFYNVVGVEAAAEKLH